MRQTIFAALGLAALLIAGASQAQVDYNDIKTGTMLDGKGIRIGAFVKPVPLPPGDWLVLARNDSRIQLTGGMDMNTTSTGLVALTLKSTDADNGIFSIIVTFTPDSTRVNWNLPSCPGTNQAFSFNVEGNGRLKGCASGQWYAEGLRKFLRGAPSHAAAMARNQYGPLAPYADQAPEPYANLYLSARLDAGRSLEYAIDARIPKDFTIGSNFDTQVRDWAKNSTRSMMDMLESKSTAMAAFPASASANTVVRTKDSGPLGAELQTLAVGAEVSNAITIPGYGTSLPLPPGRWTVAAQRAEFLDAQSVRTTLTLRNSEVNTGLAALVLTIQPKFYVPGLALRNCAPSKRDSFQMVEDLDTTADMPVSICAVAGFYAANMKQMVRNASTGSRWVQQNLAPLQPYVAEMPAAHIWMTLEAGRKDQMQVSWTLYSHTPEGLLPNNLVSAPLREWMRGLGQSMVQFLNNKYSAIAPYPPITMSP